LQFLEVCLGQAELLQIDLAVVFPQERGGRNGVAPLPEGADAAAIAPIQQKI
jgi:hypothetical protein